MAVAIGVGDAGVGEAADDLVRDLGALAGNGHVQHVGQVGEQLLLDELLGQALLTAGSQVDNVGIIASLHLGIDDVLQILVGDQGDVGAGLSGEGVADLLPDLGAVSGLDGGDLQGLTLQQLAVNGGLDGRVGGIHHGIGRGGGGLDRGLGATGQDSQEHDQDQAQCKDLLFHFFNYLLLCFSCFCLGKYAPPKCYF